MDKAFIGELLALLDRAKELRDSALVSGAPAGVHAQLGAAANFLSGAVSTTRAANPEAFDAAMKTRTL